MQPRSRNDKEYFAQAWFSDRLNELGLDWQQNGRNSYPDYWVAATASRQEGYEVKSLALTALPARTVRTAS